MTKLISTKPITFRVIAPLALGLILFSGVNGWGQSDRQTVTPPPGYILIKLPGRSAAGKDEQKQPDATSTEANSLDSVQECTATQKDVTALKRTNKALQKFDDDAQTDASKTSNPAELATINKCVGFVHRSANQVTAKINTMNKSLSKEICAYQMSSWINPVGAAGSAKHMADLSTDFSTQAGDLGTDFTKAFGAKKNPEAKSRSTGQPEQKGFKLCDVNCTDSDLHTDCMNIAKNYSDEIFQMTLAAYTEQYGAQKTWNDVRVGMGLAAVGGVVAIVKGIQHHNDANRRAKVANAYNNGILTNADGTTTDCTTAQNYLTEACQPVLMHYCTETQHAGGTGCQTFQSSYCALSTSNASYCLAGAAATYCQSYSGSSPACQWMATRPASCQANPYDQSCLTSLSNSQLATQCSSYPNDPLCQAFTQGKVVNQAGSTNIAANPLTNTTIIPSTSNAAVGGFNQLIDTGSTSSASTAPTDSSSSASTGTGSTTNSGGLTVRAQVRGQPVANMWAANSGTTVAVLCGSAGCR